MNSINTDAGYRDWLSTKTKTTDQTKGTGNNYDAVFVEEEDTGLSVDDFLSLMVAELQNQDFLNPVDNTQYVAQMAQFANLQQMQELATYSKTNYVMSLVGKNVTAARFTVSGDLDKVTGMITKVSLVDNEFKVFIGDKSFSLSQIMEVNQTPKTEDKEPDDDDKEPEDPEKTPETSSSGKNTANNELDPNVTDDNSEVTNNQDGADEAADQTQNNEDLNDSQTVSDNTTENQDPVPETTIQPPIDLETTEAVIQEMRDINESNLL